MFGLFGLGPKPTNFTDFNEPQPSFMWTLRKQSIIPSLSYAYSAGAVYRKTQAALILGCFDTSQIQENQTLRLTLDPTLNLMIGLQGIQASNTLSGVVSLLPTGIMSFLDSTVLEIWLPIAACEAFETSFSMWSNALNNGASCIYLHYTLM